jgi:hypothetical protein
MHRCELSWRAWAIGENALTEHDLLIALATHVSGAYSANEKIPGGWRISDLFTPR